jgi:hypothetical protein
LSGYTPEQANKALASFAYDRERLLKRLNGLDGVLDLDLAVRPMERMLKKRLARLINESHLLPLNPQTHRLVDPDLLVEEVKRLRAQGSAQEAHMLSRTIRDVRLVIALSTRMSKSMRLKAVDAAAFA